LLRLAFVLGAMRGEDGLGARGFYFSHEGVKRAVGLRKGFVYAIASAPRKFLYLRFLKSTNI